MKLLLHVVSFCAGQVREDVCVVNTGYLSGEEKRRAKKVVPGFVFEDLGYWEIAFGKESKDCGLRSEIMRFMSKNSGGRRRGKFED